MKIIHQKSKYHRFAFTYSYSPEVVEFCRTLKDAFGWQRFSFETNENGKMWVFSDSVLVASIKEKFPDVVVDRAVREIVMHETEYEIAEQNQREIVDEIKTKKDTDFTVIGVKGELYPYQKIGVEFLAASKGRAILADSPGVGKTAQTLAYIKHEKYKRSLIVCPASVKFAWANEAKKWTNLSTCTIDSKTKLQNIDSDVNLWIINYDQLNKHFAQLAKIHFDIIVGDEAHMIKNPAAARTKRFRLLSREIDHVVLLSGTPLLSRPVELYSLLNIIDPRKWGNYYDYVRTYCGAHQTRFGLDVSGVSNAKQLHDQIGGYFLRRTKEDVLTELPPKNHIEVPVELSTEFATKYNLAESSFISYMKQHSGKQSAEIAKTMQAEKLAQLNALRMINTMGKIPTAQDIIDSIIDSGEKIIVFSSFVEPLKVMSSKYKNNSVMITGETAPDERGEIVRKFQENPNVNVFFGGIKSAGAGITLTAASNTMFLDLPWNPADLEQASNRNHRPGIKASSVNIYQLTVPGTIDEDMKEIINRKQKIFDAIIDGTPMDAGKTTVDMVTDNLLNKYK